ncbi:MAG: FAD-dependent oxidoreductase [Elusimicrobiota bacterium]|nr:FAD-dependent oxidoreductase [Elusimicrobiota bacterium]
MKKTGVLILGGGLAGLSTARHLGVAGQRSRLVVEAKDRPGGTAGSVVTDGFTFDYTGHLLHLHDPYGKKLILDLLGDNHATHERRAWIWSKGAFTRYPFQANTRGLPPAVVADCVAGFLETVHRPRPLPKAPDFLSWSRATFGDGVTRHFMRPYNEKLWRVPLSRLTTEWQGRFVPKPSAAEVVYGAFAEQNALFGYNSTFRYPVRGGIQALPDALAAALEPGVLRTGARVESVDLREKVAVVGGLGEVRYERLVNTLPLCDFLDLATPLPPAVKAARAKLRWNTVWNLNLGVDRLISDKHWVYYPEKKYPFYRVGFSSNFSPNLAPAGHTAIYVEVARPGGSAVDVPKLEAQVLAGLREAGVLRRGDTLSAKVWMPVKVGYVVYDFDRTPAVTTIFKHLATRGVDSIGRYGGWKYSFMEETILDGKRCAERLCGREAAAESAGAGILAPLK